MKLIKPKIACRRVQKRIGQEGVERMFRSINNRSKKEDKDQKTLIIFIDCVLLLASQLVISYARYYPVS